MSSLTSHSSINILHNATRPARAVQIPIPRLRHGPALDPLYQTVRPKHNVGRHDDGADHDPHAPRRDAQQGHGEGDLAPGRGEDGAEPGRDRKYGDERVLLLRHGGVVPAEAVADAGCLEGYGDEQGDLDGGLRQKTESNNLQMNV